MEPEPRKELIQPGDGRTYPNIGASVSVHYIGYSISGKKFDSSYDRGKEFTTVIGHQKVIKAWDTLLPQMSKGEIAKLYCPAKYAYGSSGFPGLIEPNEDLVFQVHLLDIKSDNASPKTEPTAGKDLKEPSK